MPDDPIDASESPTLSWKRAALWASPFFLLWLWLTVPLVTGSEAFFYRDVNTAHIFYKHFGAEQLAEGRIPAFQDNRALGQPFRGNPNTLAFYPGNLIYLPLPFSIAFHLHYMLHWLMACCAMALLARSLGQSPMACLVSALTYGGTGWMLSCLTFYNILTVSAWWPLVLWGMVRGDRRGLCVGGAACGLAFLGGDPMSLILGLVPLAYLAWSRHGWQGGALRLSALGALALTVASPQIVATLRILGDTYRGDLGVIPGSNIFYSLQPIRWLELWIPFPLGVPGVEGSKGFWPLPSIPKVPFIFTIHVGIIALLALIPVVRRHLGWFLLASGGLFFAALGGFQDQFLRQISAGLFRYPEKFIFWYALAIPLLVGWGFEAWSRRDPPSKKWLLIPSLFGLGAAVIGILKNPFVTAVSQSPAIADAANSQSLIAGVESHVNQWWTALVWSALISVAWFMILSLPKLKPSRMEALLVLHVLALAPLTTLYMTVDGDVLQPKGLNSVFSRHVEPGSAVVSSMTTTWDDPGLEFDGATGILTQIRTETLSTPANVLHGIQRPFARDVEGLHSALFGLMNMKLYESDWQTRLNWCRALGADYLVSSQALQLDGLQELEKVEHFGVPTRLHRIDDTAPEIWWPEQVVTADHPVLAFEAVGRAEDPIKTVMVDQPRTHQPGASVHLVEHEADRLEIKVEGQGGVLAVRRAYFPIWQARSGDQSLDVFPLNLNLIGVQVPPGEHRVILDVASWPENLAGMASLLALFLAAWGALSQKTLLKHHAILKGP